MKEEDPDSPLLKHGEQPTRISILKYIDQKLIIPPEKIKPQINPLSIEKSQKKLKKLVFND
jgi:hypothetical protein